MQLPAGVEANVVLPEVDQNEGFDGDELNGESDFEDLNEEFPSAVVKTSTEEAYLPEEVTPTEKASTNEEDPGDEIIGSHEGTE